jgi:hypothetical protein
MTAGLQTTALRLGLAGALFGLVACSGDSNLVRDVAVATGVGSEPKPAPDFIASTRPADLDYIRTGVATRSAPAKSAAEVKAAEAAMDQVRTTNEARAAEARQLGSQPGPSLPAAVANP